MFKNQSAKYLKNSK